MVLGDRIQLRQVLLNLVRNAFEAMQDQGVATRTLALRTICETRDVVTIAVQDNGVLHVASGLSREDKAAQALYSITVLGLPMVMTHTAWRG